LRRPRLKIDPLRIVDVLGLIRKNGLLVHPTVVATAAKGDESDNRFLECAGAGQADYIVIGNTKHFPATFGPSRVVTPRQFIDLILPFLPHQTR
jgi:predicted nucleic acid-binding protein